MKLRISNQLHGQLKTISDALFMDLSEITRRSLRAFWRLDEGERCSILAKHAPTTRDDSTVITLEDIGAELTCYDTEQGEQSLDGADLRAVLEWRIPEAARDVREFYRIEQFGKIKVLSV